MPGLTQPQQDKVVAQLTRVGGLPGSPGAKAFGALMEAFGDRESDAKLWESLAVSLRRPLRSNLDNRLAEAVFRTAAALTMAELIESGEADKANDFEGRKALSFPRIKEAFEAALHAAGWTEERTRKAMSRVQVAGTYENWLINGDHPGHMGRMEISTFASRGNALTALGVAGIVGANAVAQSGVIEEYVVPYLARFFTGEHEYHLRKQTVSPWYHREEVVEEGRLLKIHYVKPGGTIDPENPQSAFEKALVGIYRRNDSIVTHPLLAFAAGTVTATVGAVMCGSGTRGTVIVTEDGDLEHTHTAMDRIRQGVGAALVAGGGVVAAEGGYYANQSYHLVEMAKIGLQALYHRMTGHERASVPPRQLHG